MKIKMLKDRPVDRGITLVYGKEYKVVGRSISNDGWRIEYQKPRSIIHLFVVDDEVEVIEENIFERIKNMLRAE